MILGKKILLVLALLAGFSAWASESEFERAENAAALKLEKAKAKAEQEIIDLKAQKKTIEAQEDALNNRIRLQEEKVYLVDQKNPCAELPAHMTDGWFEDYDSCLKRLVPAEIVLGSQAAGLGCPNYPGLNEKDKKATLGAIVKTNAFMTSRFNWRDDRNKYTGLFASSGLERDPFAKNPYASLQREVERMKTQAAKGSSVLIIKNPKAIGYLSSLLPGACKGSIGGGANTNSATKLDGTSAASPGTH